MVGVSVGCSVDANDGNGEVGATSGVRLGSSVGDDEGGCVVRVGESVGSRVGSSVGDDEGCCVARLGESVGV